MFLHSIPTFLLILNFSWVLGLLIGVLAYLYLSVQPRYLGFAVILLTCLILAPAVWDENLFDALFVINLIVVTVLSLFFQMRVEEAEDDKFEDDSIQILTTHKRARLGSLERTLGGWIDFSIAGYSILAGVSFVLSSWDGDNIDNGFFYCFSAMGIQMMVIRLRGGRKGKVWSSIREALQFRGGIIPRPM